MCESSAFIMGKNNELIKIMDYIVNINPDGDKVYLTDLFGNQKIIHGVIKEMRLIDHKIILQENK